MIFFYITFFIVQIPKREMNIREEEFVRIMEYYNQVDIANARFMIFTNKVNREESDWTNAEKSEMKGIQSMWSKSSAYKT